MYLYYNLYRFSLYVCSISCIFLLLWLHSAVRITRICPLCEAYELTCTCTASTSTEANGRDDTETSVGAYFVSWFLSLSSVMLLNTFVITFDHLALCASSFRLSALPIAMIFLPRERTTRPMALTRSFASIGPSLWSRLYPPLRSSIFPLLEAGAEMHWKRFCLAAVRSAI